MKIQTKRLSGRFVGVAAGLLLGASVIGLSACGKSSSSPTEPDLPADQAQTANVTTSFTATGRTFIRKQITIPATMSFKLTGVDMSEDVDMEPLVYFYDQRGFSGGRGGRGFNGDLRNQKLKVYDVHDDLMGHESERYGYEWRSRDTVPCTISWDAGGVSINVGGATFRKNGAVANTFTVGIGVPPESRPGWTGITFTDIVWPAGAVSAGEFTGQ